MRVDHDPETQETELHSIPLDRSDDITDMKGTVDPHALADVPAAVIVSKTLEDIKLDNIKLEEDEKPNSTSTLSSTSSAVSAQDLSVSFFTRIGTGPHILLPPSGPTASLSRCSQSLSRPNQEQSSGSVSFNQHNLISSSTSPASSPASSSTTLSQVTRPTSGLIHLDGSVYAAVPISSEVHIIPKSSRDFQWNGDLFLKPHQRRSLGIDHLFTSGGDRESGELGNGYSLHRANHVHQAALDASVMVHEIRLDDEESACILPSWP